MDRNPKAIWAGLTDEEQLQVTAWIAHNVRVISVAEYYNSLKTEIDHDGEIRFGIDRQLTEIRSCLAKFVCVCGAEKRLNEDIIEHVLLDHLRDIKSG